MSNLQRQSSTVGYPMAPEAAKPSRPRLDSVDMLRGLVMVIMALDHTRGYFFQDPITKAGIDPVNLTDSNPLLFFTRWITHYCAPTFVFLAGTGAFLFRTRGKSKLDLCWFLLSRGLWLVLLELTLVRWGWGFSWDYHGGMGGGVIWAIGWSMVCMSVLTFLPTSAVAALGICLIAFHNLTDFKTASEVGLGEQDGLWVVLHSGGNFQMPHWLYQSFGWIWDHWPGHGPSPYSEDNYGGFRFGTGYCLIPWLGTMAAGYGLGAIFLLDRPQRRWQLFGLGLIVTLAFVALRYSNFYGDPPTRNAKTDQRVVATLAVSQALSPTAAIEAPVSMAIGNAAYLPVKDLSTPAELKDRPGPWSVQKNWVFTLLSFLNCQKYPPSLMYLLMTLGPALLALALFDFDAGPIGRFFVIFGRVPLFFYLLHIPLIHGLKVEIGYILLKKNGTPPEGGWTMDKMKEYGFDLPWVYVVWIGVILILFPLCWWFSRVKQKYKAAWLSYL